MDRNLDGIYFRVNRNGEWKSICFSDLTQKEREEVIENIDIEKQAEWWKRVAYHLADRLKLIGDEFNIINVD